MGYVIGCLMAGLSFLLNKLLLKYVGIKVVISYSPVVEEVSKTLCSYYLAADIIITHMIFGVLEASYDWYQQRSKERGRIAALLSISGHTLFGVVTVAAFKLSESIFLAIVIAIAAHLIWNITWIRLSA